MVADERVVDQSLVRLQHAGGRVVSVVELHARIGELDVRARPLGEERGGDAAVVGQIKGEMIGLHVVDRHRRTLEQGERRLLEGDGEDSPAFGKLLAGAELP